jgi:hypothetical protein
MKRQDLYWIPIWIVFYIIGWMFGIYLFELTNKSTIWWFTLLH